MDPASPAPAVAPPRLANLTANPLPAKPAVAPKLPEVVVVWPRCAQFAGVFLCGALAALLCVHLLSYLRAGTQPSEVDQAPPVSYRVELNDARHAELLQLPGVGPNLADRIEAYRQNSGGFRSVNELLKVKGIGPTTLERLRPFVWVRALEGSQQPEKVYNTAPTAKPASNKAANLEEPINVNQASLAELQKLPGIGPKISQKIVDERERKPFTSVDDLRRVSGIGPKTLEKLKPFVVVGGQ